jgi:hypothetical protein
MIDRLIHLINLPSQLASIQINALECLHLYILGRRVPSRTVTNIWHPSLNYTKVILHSVIHHTLLKMFGSYILSLVVSLCPIFVIHLHSLRFGYRKWYTSDNFFQLSYQFYNGTIAQRIRINNF